MESGSPADKDTLASQFIAVIGMAGRFPEAPTLEALWDNLAAGRECIARFSDEELDAAGVPEHIRKSPDFVNARAIIDRPFDFDALFFGFAPTEAKLTDPQHRLFLECAWEALENAGYDPARYPDLIGVYAGADVNSYALGNILLPTHDLQGLIGNDKDYLATRASYKLNLRGPALTIQTACSTSLVAVQVACQSLLGYQCDTALAGGVGLAFPQKTGYVYQKGGILSPDGHCRTFDAKSRGTVGGDGIGIVVLKRLADALAAGDNIRAVIRGAAINNDGAMKVGFTAPSVEGQAEVIAMALAMAGVEADTISYVEAHGTATELGDPVEIAALTEAYRAHTDKKGYCAIGSIKSNLGHMNSAAGVGGLIKAVLALEHRLIPPSLHYESPNPMIDFASSPFFVNAAPRPWETSGIPRRAAVSSFGVGGTNAHVILEEAPPAPETGPSRARQLLLLSAKSEAALRAATSNLARHLAANPGLPLADVAYTLSVGRQLFKHRRMIVCQTTEDASAALTAPPPAIVREPRRAPVVFMFPGQGSQHVDMGRDLYETEPVFRDEVDACCRFLEPILGLDLLTLLYPDEARAAEAAEQLGRTAITQPALFVVEWALAQLWMSWGVRPEAMIGHSIGEYVAACIAGVMLRDDALTLVAARGRLMQRMPAGSMIAAPIPEEEAARFPSLAIAALNAPGVTVLSGADADIESALRDLRARGSDGSRLHTSHAFHSAMMDPILDEFRAAVSRVALSAPRIPYVSNLTGTFVSAAEATSPAYWVSHLRRTVRFGAGVAELLADPDRVLLEVGPGKALSALAAKHGDKARERTIASLSHPREQASSLASVLEALGRLALSDVPVDWSAFWAGQDRRRVPLPTYPFERQHYAREFDRQLLEATQGRAAPAKSAKVEEWLHVPSWRRSPPVDDTAPPPTRPLVFADRSQLGAELQERIERQSPGALTVLAGAAFQRLGPNRWEIDPAAADHYDKLLEDIVSAGGPPTDIIHCWSLASSSDSNGEAWCRDREGAVSATPPSPLPDGRGTKGARFSDTFDEAQKLGFFSLLYLAQACIRRKGEPPIPTLVVTSEVAEVLGDDAIRPEKAPILSLCQVLPQECPGARCRAVDVGARGDRKLIDAVLAELRAPSDDDFLVAYRGGRRWTLGYEPIRRSGAPTPDLRPGGVYLIAGGLGGLGLTLADQLARRVRAKLVLTSRTGLVAREEWDAWIRSHDDRDRVSRRIRKIRELESLGSEVMILNADVADERQMAAAVDRTIHRFGALHGVIHAAGAMGADVFRAVLDTAPRHVEAHFRPKVQGLHALDRVLPRSLDFVLLCSSLSTVLGGVGFAGYAAANHYLDAFAAARSCRDETPWISVDWDAWQPDGADAASGGIGGALAAMAIRADEGGEALARILSLSGVAQVVVSTAPLAARREQVKRQKDAARSTQRSEGEAAQTHPRPALDTEYVAPRNELETELADIWQKLLGIDQIGVNDNFFKLGGDSLVAIQLGTRLRDAYGLDIPVNDLFDEPTIAGLATKIERLRAEGKGGRDAIEATLSMIENLPEEEVKRLLAELDR